MTVDQLQALREKALQKLASVLLEIRSANGQENLQTTANQILAITQLDAEIQKQQVIESGGTSTTTTNVSIGTTTR